jgi:hypothetical protein
MRAKERKIGMNIGDRVVIRLPLNATTVPNHRALRKYNGRVGVITGIADGGKFKLNVDEGAHLWPPFLLGRLLELKISG